MQVDNLDLPPLVVHTNNKTVADEIFTTEALLARADAGDRLNSTDRRHCLALLMTTAPHLSRSALAVRFQVSESCIRKDHGIIEELNAKEEFEADATRVVARALSNITTQMAALEKSKDKCNKGTRDYVLHCKVLADLGEKKVKLLRDLGFIGTDLGLTKSTNFEYVAVVRKGDQIDTRAVEHFTDDDADLKRLKASDQKRQDATKEQPVVEAEREIVYYDQPPQEIKINTEEVEED